MQLLVQTCLVEFHTKGDIQRSQQSIFRFFTETNFLKSDWAKVKLHLSTLRQELKNIANETHQFKFNAKEFTRLMGAVISLAEDIYVAYYQF